MAFRHLLKAFGKSAAFFAPVRAYRSGGQPSNESRPTSIPHRSRVMAFSAAFSRRSLNRLFRRWSRPIPATPATRLGLQAMEDRVTPSTFFVTNTFDSGANSLRAAIANAKSLAGADTIQFLGVTGTINLLTELSITDTDGLNIQGPGASQLTINGGGNVRVLSTTGSSAGAAISISGMTLTGGKAAGGAGILIGDEAVSLTNCIVTGNTSTLDGGGIYVTSAAGSLNLQGCTVSNNSTSGSGIDGGGIAFQLAGSMVMNNTTVSGNTSADSGGGVYFRNGGQFSITNSTISGNAGGSTTVSIGGGLYFFGTASGPLLIQNSTVSSNTIGGAGGGIVLANFTGALSVQNSTVAFNSSTAVGAVGGGIARTGGSGSVQLDSTILAKNTSQSNVGADMSFTSLTLVTGTGNLIGVGDSGNGAVGAFGNQFGTKASPLDPQLGALALNSGTTKTHRPSSNSPAVDKGTNPAGLLIDQRGVTRTLGSAIDVGAVEAPSTILVTNANDAGEGSLRKAIDDANLDVGIFNVIAFDSTFFATPRTIAMSTGELAITDGVGIAGPGNLTLDAGGLSRHFNIDGPGNLSATLIGMSLINGQVASGNGGAILMSNEDVVLDSMKITNCTATTGDGGAIANKQGLGKLTINNSYIGSNSAPSATGRGGAISLESYGTLSLLHTHLANNTAGGDGGGIAAPNGGILTIDSSTLSGNIANHLGANSNHGGGGIFFYGQLGTSLEILNSTISGNQATNGQGGGVMMLSFNGTTVVRNSTITNNKAGAASRGGGIMSFLGSGNITLESSIVAGNTNANAPDIYTGGTVTATKSAIGSATGIAMSSFDATTNGFFGVNLKLGSLANNGGSTPTHMPALDSPLLNKGSNSLAAATDQRGTGYGRTRSGGVDIGAVEAPTNFVVTTDADLVAGSLRQAVADANAFIGADTITFDPLFFSTPRTMTVTAAFGSIEINEAVSIVGPGTNLVTANGNNATRIFDTVGAPTDAVINISGMTFSGGKGVQGGAIRVSDEQLVLNNCVFNGNISPSYGGAIGVIFGGGLTATDCVFTNNVAPAGDGGAIFISANSSISLQRCTLSGNQADRGGAIYCNSGLNLDSCTVSGNQATGVAGGGEGGGIFISHYGIQTTVIHNSTISGNKAQTSGGGIYCDGYFANALSILNSTITANIAVTGKGGGVGRGTAYLTTISGSIISGNNNATAPDIFSPGVVNVNYSAIGDPNGFMLTSEGGNLPFGTNLKLGPLANNGGPTQTHKPLAGSPVIDAGSNVVLFGFDQRGVTRTIGKSTDIGSVEVALPLIVTNSADSGFGSLRQNISDANIDPGANTITFDPVFFSNPQTIRVNTGELLITESVTITGPGSTKVVLDAQGMNRVINISIPAPGSTVTLSGLTITGGNTAQAGGGISAGVATLNLTDCVITGNTANGSGGGIVTGGLVQTLTLDHCVVANNFSSFSHGGGLSFESGSKINAFDSTFSGNSAYFAGGGIDIYLGGSALLSGCTISGNTSNSIGGGLYINGTVGAGGMMIRNSTISGNSAPSGGGILVSSITGTLTVQNSTITNNSATAGKGGGIANATTNGLIALESTIISGNSTVVAGPDVSAPGTVNATTSLFGSIAGITTLNMDAITNSLKGQAPLLGPLANNGGPTKTHALLPGSPAINNGSNPAFQLTDQRDGGFVRVFGGSPDIGAFEVQTTSKVTSVVINNGDAQRSRVTTITVTFDQIVTMPVPAESAFQLRRQSDGLVIGLSANVVNGATTTVTLTFTGPKTEAGSLPDGRYTLNVLAGQTNGGNFDGNGDGTAGDDYALLGDTTTNKLFRLFGDADGNGVVTASDFNAFRLVYGTTGPSIFDIDGSNSVTASDFNAFRLRYGVSI